MPFLGSGKCMSESSLFISQVKMVWLLLHGNIKFLVQPESCLCLHIGLRNHRP